MTDLSRYLTLIPALFAIQLFLIHRAARKAANTSQIVHPGWITLLLSMLVLWGGVTAWLGASGVYLTDGFLASYPTFWLPFVPVVLVLTPLIFFSSARKAVDQLIDATPASFLIAFHILRISALGTAIKALMGEFSHAFEIWVGIPDLLYGLSAIWMYRAAQDGHVGPVRLFGWNLVGVLVIIPGAPLIAQRELPGVLYVADKVPPMTTLYEFPMVLAPSLVVPLFVTVNLLVAFRLLRRIIAGDGNAIVRTGQ